MRSLENVSLKGPAVITLFGVVSGGLAWFFMLLLSTPITLGAFLIVWAILFIIVAFVFSFVFWGF